MADQSSPAPQVQLGYGSDSHGLIWGYRFLPGQSAQPITSEAAAELLATPAGAAKGEFLWLHFSLANIASEPWMRRCLTLPEAFYVNLKGDVATRLEQDADALVTVIHDVLFDFTFDPEAVGTATLCVQPRLLVSTRLRPLRSVDQLRSAVRAAHVFRSSAELLAHLLEDQAHVLADILRRSTARVDQIEDQLLARRVSATRAELGSLRRVLVRLERLLVPEPSAMFRLLNKPPEWILSADLQALRQAAEEFAAAVGDAQQLVERVKLIQEETFALVSEQTNRILFVLTVVTVLALPINLVAGLFGMNVGGIPLSDHGHGFLMIVGSLLALTALLAYLTLGRRRD